MSIAAALDASADIHVATTRGDLLPILNALKPVLPKHPWSPAFAGIVFDGADQSVWATDYETTLSFDFPVGEGRSVVQLEPLHKAVKAGGTSRKALAEPVTITVTGGVGVVRVGGLQVPVQVWPVEDYSPKQTLQPQDFVATISAGVLRSTWDAVVKATAPAKEMLPILTAVHVQVDGASSLRMTATDRYRMHDAQTYGIGCGQDWEGAIPAHVGQHLKTLGGDDQQVTISTGLAVNAGQSGGNVLFRSEGVALSTRLLESEYPNVDRLWPDSKEHFLVDRDQLIAAATTVKPHLARNVPVRLTFHDGTLTVGGTTDNGDVSAPAIAAETSVADFVIGFNPGFLLDALKTYSPGCVRFAVTSPDRPAVITHDIHNPGIRVLLMPVRNA